jgi:hypothetical protein
MLRRSWWLYQPKRRGKRRRERGEDGRDQEMRRDRWEVCTEKEKNTAQHLVSVAFIRN